MKALLIILIVLAIFLSAYVMYSVITDMIKSKRVPDGETAAIAVPSATEQPISEQPATEPVTEITPVEPTVLEQTDSEPGIVIRDGVPVIAVKTLEEKYAELEPQYKQYFDEIAAYAAAVDGSECIKKERFEEYRVGKTRLVRMLIRRSTVTCEFILINADFRKSLNAGNVSAQQSATVLKVKDDGALAAAKKAIDISYKLYGQDKVYREKLAAKRAALAEKEKAAKALRAKREKEAAKKAAAAEKKKAAAKKTHDNAVDEEVA